MAARFSSPMKKRKLNKNSYKLFDIMISEGRPMTAEEIRVLLGSSRQDVHQRLNRHVAYGWIKREKIKKASSDSVWGEPFTKRLCLYWSVTRSGKEARANPEATRAPRKRPVVVPSKTSARLRARSHGLQTIGSLSKETGYDRHRISTAADQIGLTPKALPRIDPRQSVRVARRGFEPEEVEKLVSYLRSLPDAMNLVNSIYPQAHSSKHWGVGGRPCACRRCERTNRRHFAHGLCSACYQAWLKADKPALPSNMQRKVNMSFVPL